MKALLDANILVALFTADNLTSSASRVPEMCQDEVLVSDFALAEFASTVAKKLRMGDLSRQEAEAAFRHIDVWSEAVGRRVLLTSVDIEHASEIMRSLTTTLRAPDALHVAMALRLEASLATLDRRMATEASRLSVPVLG